MQPLAIASRGEQQDERGRDSHDNRQDQIGRIQRRDECRPAGVDELMPLRTKLIGDCKRL
jgi:hypothetical protein